MPQFKAAIAALGLNVNNLLGINHKTFDLTAEQFDLFKKVYIRFLQGLKSEERKKHTIEHIDSIVWDSEQENLRVTFDNGDRIHYTKQLTWY